ncbi:hypothetical protein [Sinomicrobium sp. M5D2P17]
MRLLIDTNILIHREASQVHNEDIGLLFNWIDRLRYEKCVHPLSKEEIKNHKDAEVVKTMMIKIENYNILKTESTETDKITQLRKVDITRNDFIDTSIIKEVYNDRVDYLITEDRGIHKKAKFLGISEKVFKIDDFLEKSIAENPEFKDYQVLAVKKEYFGNINLEDNFFRSFLEDYKEFRGWFNRKADNIAYVCITDNLVRAFLYLKVEEINSELYNDIHPAFKPKKRLKIGTFKVTSTGFKLGERFLKIIFDNALQYKVDEIYVTIFAKREEQIRLIHLLQDWGFLHWGEKISENGSEQVFVRIFEPNFDVKNPKRTYPYISRKNRILMVPIYPAYHTELLPDSVLNNEMPNDYIENEPHRNAIKKVYISRSFNRNLSKGDLILFYRTGGFHKSVITTIGIVDTIHNNIKNEKQFIELCRKRSVFSGEELKKHWNYKFPNGKWVAPFIVNFLYIYTFPKRLNLARLIALGIISDIKSVPRGFEPISQEKFDLIIKESKTDESYFID